MMYDVCPVTHLSVVTVVAVAAAAVVESTCVCVCVYALENNFQISIQILRQTD